MLELRDHGQLDLWTYNNGTPASIGNASHVATGYNAYYWPIGHRANARESKRFNNNNTERKRLMELTVTQLRHIHDCLTSVKNDQTREGQIWSSHGTNASARTAIENEIIANENRSNSSFRFVHSESCQSASLCNSEDSPVSVTMADIVHSGIPICGNCGDDLELKC